MYTFRNPPAASMATTAEAKTWLPEMCLKNTLFTLHHAACSPLVRITSCVAEALGDDLYKITATVANQGFLPTNLTQISLKHGTSQPPQVTLDAPQATVLIGGAQTTIPHLAGRDERTATWSPWMRDWSQTAHQLEWLVRGQGLVTVTVQTQRAGVHHVAVQLGG
jgi:hypothetical protein